MAKRRIKHSKTLFDTVIPASHRINLKLKLELLTPLEPGTYLRKADWKIENKNWKKCKEEPVWFYLSSSQKLSKMKCDFVLRDLLA